MNIANYDFHDGYLIEVQHHGDKMEISMESAQISQDDMNDNLELSNHETLKGKLHLENIKEIKVNDQSFYEKFKKPHDEGDVYNFDIQDNKVTLIIAWQDHPPSMSLETDMWCTYEIEAEKIYWENIPNLHNPYWL